MKRNWLHETIRQEMNRRLNAVEVHIQDLEGRYSELENEYLLLKERIRVITERVTDLGDAQLELGEIVAESIPEDEGKPT